MRYVQRLIWAVAMIAISAAPGFGQVTSSTVTPGGVTQTTTAGGGGGGGTGSPSTDLQGTTLSTMEPAPNIAAPTGSASSSITDPIFGGYAGNPYFQGLLPNAKSGAAAGGFGSVTIPVSSGSTNGQFGVGGGAGGAGGAGGRGGAGGATGRAGGTGSSLTGLSSRAGGTTAGGGGGFAGGGAGGGFGGGGGVNGSNTLGIVVPLEVPTLAYISRPYNFEITPIASTQLQTDLTGMIARSASTITNPAGVEVVASADNDIILRGKVANADEARLVEGMVRLTPGVRYIQNDLTFPVGSKGTFVLPPR